MTDDEPQAMKYLTWEEASSPKEIKPSWGPVITIGKGRAPRLGSEDFFALGISSDRFSPNWE